MSLAEAERSAAAWRRALACPPSCFWLLGKRELGAVGKWETGFWFSTFPSALVAGAVGMWESRRVLVRFPRGMGGSARTAVDVPVTVS